MGESMTKKSPKDSSIEILFALLFMGSLFFSIPAYAEEHNWVFLGEIEGDLWFIDTDSITCKENTCKTWVKMLSRTSVKKISIENGEYTKSLHEYNCTWREYRILQTTKYDTHGNVMTTVSQPESGRKHKVPEPISNILYDLVCKKSSQQKEQQGTEEKYPEKGDGEAQRSAAENYIAEKTEEPAIQSQIEQPQSQVKSVPEKVVHPGKTAKIKKETRKKSPRIQKSVEPVFTIQVGAFKNHSYAESLKTMLTKKGYNTSIATAKSKEEELHKVRIGKFSDRKKAQSLSEEIKKTEGLQAFVTSW
jgi:cell division septation protein DedD